MAIKILSLSEKNNLTLDELLSYEKKLREEVARREARFKPNDKYFRMQSLKYQETINERNYIEKFPKRRAGDIDDVKIGIKVLEKTIKSSQSTLKGRKEILDLSFKSFNARLEGKGEEPISRRKYNKIAKFFDALDDLNENDDLASYFYDSENIIDVVNEGIEFDTLVKTFNTLEKINQEKKYGMSQYSIEMLKDVYKVYKKTGEEKDLEEIIRKYSRLTSESNE